MQKRLGQSICLFSGKGGVGKTITALNLAGIYEIMEKKILIMDFDLFGGGISLALNKAYNKTIYNFFDDCMNNRYEDIRNYITKYDNSIDILASPKDPRQAGKISSEVLEKAIDEAKYSYDIILIDTTHSLNEINLVLLDKADTILFVINNDPLDLKNIKNLLAIFKNLEKTNYRILLNQATNLYKNYFTLYDIKNIIKANVDYLISNEFYIKNIDQYIMNGLIITLQPKVANTFSKDFTVLTKLATDMLKKEGQNE